MISFQHCGLHSLCAQGPFAQWCQILIFVALKVTRLTPSQG